MQMKKNINIFITLFYTTFVFAKKSNEQIRINQLFNFNWKFQLGDDANAQNINYDDSKWRQLNLPHDFQIEQPWDSTANKGRRYKTLGIGWYRKAFKADVEWKGKKYCSILKALC